MSKRCKGCSKVQGISPYHNTAFAMQTPEFYKYIFLRLNTFSTYSIHFQFVIFVEAPLWIMALIPLSRQRGTRKSWDNQEPIRSAYKGQHQTCSHSLIQLSLYYFPAVQKYCPDIISMPMNRRQDTLVVVIFNPSKSVKPSHSCKQCVTIFYQIHY